MIYRPVSRIHGTKFMIMKPIVIFFFCQNLLLDRVIIIIIIIIIILIKTRSKDPVEDIVVFSARTIFVIRQKLALKRDY